MIVVEGGGDFIGTDDRSSRDERVADLCRQNDFRQTEVVGKSLVKSLY